MVEIPLNSSPEQLFSIVLNDENYDCRVVYNTRLSIWSISFFKDNVPIVLGVGLVGGVDILNQYNLNISNMYTVNTSNASLDADSENLGDAVVLVMLSDDELELIENDNAI